MNRNLFLAGLASALSFFLVAPAFGFVTYNVNLGGPLSYFDPLGNTETVTGTITTDGALGLLQPSNIVGFNFSAAGAITFSISSSNTTFSCPETGCELQAVGNELIATSQGLTAPSEIEFHPPLPNAPFPFDVDENAIRFVSDPTQGIGVTQAIVFNSNGLPVVMDNENGPTSIVVGTVAAVPEPKAYGLMLAGLGLVVFVAHRCKQHRKNS